MIQTDVGRYVKSVLALAPVQITAGESGDGQAQNGVAIDRLGYLSAVAVVPVSATLGQGNTLTISAKVQDSADGSTGWADYGSGTGNVVLTGGTGGSTETALLELNVNLAGARRYIRVVVTGDLSASSTDTQRFGAVLILGGADVKPV
jgi:hypothetical protein